MIHISDPGSHRVEGLERAHQRAGRENFDFDAASGRGADCLREAHRARMKARCTFRPVGHQLELAQAPRDRGRWEA
jgi:hypothetical protein